MFTYSTVKDLAYVDSDNKAIKMVVKFDHLETEVPFIAKGDDVEPHGVELYQRACKGDFGAIAAFVQPTISLDQKQSQFKSFITNLLETKAKELGFESIADSMTYVDEPSVPLYQQQAVALRKWRSLCWAQYDAVIETAKDFGIEAVIEALPAFKL